MATRKITIEQEVSLADSVFEIIGAVAGLGLAAGTGFYMNQFLPAAATATEEVLRKGTIGLGSFTTGYFGSKAVEGELHDIHEAAVMTKLMTAGLLSKEDIQAIEQEKEVKVSAKK